MSTAMLVSVAAFVLAAPLAAGRAFAEEAPAGLAAGVAAADITPPKGYRMSGYFHERLADGVRDPLHAKAVVFRQGDRAAAMVFCDVIGIAPNVSAEARKRAAEKTHIPAENILIAATHSHTGPLYFGALRKHFHDAAVAAKGRDDCESVDYPAKLTAAIVEAISKAAAATRAVRVEAGSAEQLGLSFNRRFHMTDGSVRFNPGVRNPNIVRPAGPIDPEVGIVLLREAGGEDGKPLAAIVNFALHLDTVGGTKYSADYPFYLQRALRAELGKDLLVLFATGTCGDINHFDVSGKQRLKTQQIGETLAKTVLAAVGKLRPVAPSLAVRREIVRMPLQQYSDERVARARKEMARVADGKVAFLQRVETYKILALEMRGSAEIDLECQAFRLGKDLAVVSLPGEIFVELGLAIKRASPLATTLVIELAQDAPGYLPTKKAFSEGSYETVNSRIAPGGAEKLVAAAQRLLKDLAEAP